MFQAGYEPATPASERPQTRTSDRAANGIGWNFIFVNNFTKNTTTKMREFLKQIKEFYPAHSVRLSRILAIDLQSIAINLSSMSRYRKRGHLQSIVISRHVQIDNCYQAH
jgi:hypothetical protein